MTVDYLHRKRIPAAARQPAIDDPATDTASRPGRATVTATEVHGTREILHTRVEVESVRWRYKG